MMFELNTVWCGCLLSLCGFMGTNEEKTISITERAAIESVLDGLPSLAEVEDSLDQRRANPPEYRGISSLECRQLAAKASAVARRLESEISVEAAATDETIPKDAEPATRSEMFERAILKLAVLQARNVSVGKALELFYLLAEEEVKLDATHTRLLQADDVLDKGKTLIERGLDYELAYNIVRRERLDLREESVDAQLRIEQINGELLDLLGFDSIREKWRIWPAPELVVAADAGDAETAVAEGLKSHPELRFLGLLVEQLDEETLPAVRQIVQGIELLLTVEPALVRYSMLTHAKNLFAIRSEQIAGVDTVRGRLETHLANRRRAVANEIRRAAGVVEGRLHQVVLASARAENWQTTVEELQEKSVTGEVSFREISAATSESIIAKSDVMSRVLAWAKARVLLEKAQGTLGDG